MDRGSHRASSPLLTLLVFLGICVGPIGPATAMRFEEDALMPFEPDEENEIERRSRPARWRSDDEHGMEHLRDRPDRRQHRRLRLAALRESQRQGRSRARRAGPGHDFDGIEELNNPLPAWWTWLFMRTIVFGVVLLRRSTRASGTSRACSAGPRPGSTRPRVAAADANMGRSSMRYNSSSRSRMISDERGDRDGRRIFANNCATCHGSDARGGRGYPNLTDGDWLYGGSPRDDRHDDHPRAERQ